MQQNSSRISREQQVKVVVRLKPEEEPKCLKCVYLSQLQNQLVVETDLKKEIFVFDHVAHPSTTQLDIYKTIGQQAVSTSYEGYNCSIFAYGQTGAGKTYSIMGNLDDLQQNIYCQSRGILPRIIEDIVKELNTDKHQKYTLTCSYIEIYNEHIFDLLSSDKRSHQIRQSKKGVFIEGLKESQLTSYKQGIQLIMEGQNSRKMAVTTMNTQSSRSHVIFTIFIQSKIIEEQRIITKKSKLNIIDLAGSERIKHTNVEGQRLKQGCNINKSLHVLGNVINALVESAKKKKYIPYRDSKLTYYLKDSLGGNSVTKVLANIHCGKEYFGDTLSTLMFAKRIKNLKLKVELNVNQSDNFNNLRQEVKRLREELAEARYFKNESQKQNESDYSMTFQKVTDNTDYEVTPKLQIIQIFQQNELHYKSLIQIYEAHMKQCVNNHFLRRQNSINIVGNWKALQSKNNALMGLLKRFPSFSKIYKENLLLKQSKSKEHEEHPNIHKSNNQYIKISDQTQLQQKEIHHHKINSVQTEQIIKKYQDIISEMHEKFTACLQTLEKNYVELQSQCKRKDKKIKQILQNSEVSPQIQDLQNENEYLHLNILNLQNEISKMQQNQAKIKIQNRQTKRNSIRNSKHQSFISQGSQCQENDQELVSVIEKLKQIHIQALKQAETAESEKKEMEHIINQLRNQITSLMNQNNKLQRKQQRSRSRKSRQHRSQMTTSTFINNQTSILCFPPKSNSSKNAQSEIKNIHHTYSKQIMSMKLQIKVNQKQIIDLRNQIDCFMSSDFKIQQEFGKGIDQIIVEYRNLLKKQKIKQDQRFRLPKSNKVYNKQVEKRFAATTKFDQIYLNQKKETKNLHINIQNRASKGKIDQLKKEVAKGGSSAKNSNNNSNMSSKSNSFFQL